MKKTYEVTDQQLAVSNRDNIIVGSAFAFIKPELFASKQLRWMRSLFKGSPDQAATIVVPILGPKSVDLPGVSMHKQSCPQLHLRSITTDKMLYQSEADAVHLLIYDPVKRNRKRTLIVRLNEIEHAQHTVTVGGNGEALLILRDLLAGQYSVAFDDETKADLYCQFTVAQYKLVPLVATLVAQETDKGKLKAKIKVESFGTPVDGVIKIDLIDGTRRIYSTTAQAAQGYLNTELQLEGAGPHQIQLQVESDATKTASVPIVGSRESERKTTLFSPLGTEITGSLLPTGDCQEVRGIFLSEGAVRTTPVSVKALKNGKLELEIRQKFEVLAVVAVDPTHPQPFANGLDANSNHPALIDPQYARAEQLFKAAEFAQALAIFQECSDGSEITHPNYEYYKACCHARLGNTQAAISCLRNSIHNGWKDFDYIANDEDLSSLRGNDQFLTLCNGGMRQQNFENLEAGQVISVDVFSPACLVALGGWTNGAAWEGWTTAICPDKIDSAIEVQAVYVPGKEVQLSVANVGAGASIYCIVKDARLISVDTPKSRLASSIKNYVDELSKELQVGTPKTTLYDTAQIRIPPPTPQRAGAWGGDAEWGAAPTPTGAWSGDGIQTGSSSVLRSASPMPMASYGSAPAGSAYGSGAAGARMSLGSSFNEQAQTAGSPMMSMQAPMAAPATDGWGSPAPAMSGRSDPQTVAVLERSPGVDYQPEVLFAGFLPVADGRATMLVRLPDVFADYVVECFVTTDDDWKLLKESFRAEKADFVDLNLPLFAAVEDQAVGQVYAQTKGSAATTLRLTRNGESVKLIDLPSRNGGDQKTISKSFTALPGDYRVELISADGSILDVQQKRVQEPGKLKHHVKGVRLLGAGESISIDDLSGVDSLVILPGLSNTFDVVVEATADYSHCCCEQTAAKMLAACSMYLFAGDDDASTRSKAESMILAGIKRELSMWEKGQGLRAYPGRELSPHWGAAAARHLWHLSSLKSFAGSGKMSSDLAKAVNQGLEIAKDVTAVHKMEWPPSKIVSCEDAYMVVRSQVAERLDEAVSFVRTFVEAGNFDKPEKLPANPYYGGAVLQRQQAAYAAAVLFRSKQTADMRHAIKLADLVTRQFNESGRLYSTVDSAAAIALLSELRQRSFGSGGKVEINGGSASLADTADASETIKSIKVLEGVLAVQVSRLVEEDWSKFSSNADISVALMKDKSAQRKLKLSDNADLVVTIAGGYKEGDVLWVCLPEALSRIFGGGQVKMFSMDFAGAKEVSIPLAATGLTRGMDGEIHPQHMAVCLRNMFEEERLGNPGLIAITVV